MSGIFSKPEQPRPEKPPPVPTRSDPAVVAAADEERRRLAASSRATSWLTGGLGVPRGSFATAGARTLSGQA